MMKQDILVLISLLILISFGLLKWHKILMIIIIIEGISAILMAEMLQWPSCLQVLMVFVFFVSEAIMIIVSFFF
uniref:NADH dehydrogenase subunit 4L n=1 Tax=Xiphinema pachtaicum TaxID=260251 RepID=A0A1P8C793_9BILA|nr:NADH dehydrogenase subunit 4L [Xiphinema pachtaicum]AOT84270.1 NADH dehydrogenase subunit 4L [Xiphinema pachtaicum]